MAYIVKDGTWLARKLKGKTRIEEHEARRFGWNVRRLLGLGLLTPAEQEEKASTKDTNGDEIHEKDGTGGEEELNRGDAEGAGAETGVPGGEVSGDGGDGAEAGGDGAPSPASSEAEGSAEAGTTNGEDPAGGELNRQDAKDAVAEGQSGGGDAEKNKKNRRGNR